MLDVHLDGSLYVRENRPFRPRMSHSRFFLGNYCCLFMPEFGSRSQIERVVRKKIAESNDKTWTVKSNDGKGMTLLYDEESDGRQVITGRIHD